MSESMVERVAKAIHKSRQERGFSGAAAWEYEPDQIHDLFRHSARAAIEAMREPNVDMIDSACAAWVKLYPAFEGEKPQPKAGEVATTIFNAMIDTTLTPAKVDEAR